MIRQIGLLSLMLVFSGSSLADPTFGRLFHTPAERAELDRRPPRPDLPSVVPDGEIRRSDGRVLHRYDNARGWVEASPETRKQPRSAGDTEPTHRQPQAPR